MDPTLTKAEKEAKLKELRESVALLEAELQRDIEREQHDAIDHLESYFETVEHKLQHLKSFWFELRQDLKNTFKKD